MFDITTRRRFFGGAATETLAADGRQLKPQIPWLRVFVEGVVIGGSIRVSPSGAWASSP